MLLHVLLVWCSFHALTSHWWQLLGVFRMNRRDRAPRWLSHTLIGPPVGKACKKFVNSLLKVRKVARNRCQLVIDLRRVKSIFHSPNKSARKIKLNWNFLCNFETSAYEYIETYSTFFPSNLIFSLFRFKSIGKTSKWAFFTFPQKAIFLLCAVRKQFVEIKSEENLIANHTGEPNNWYQLSFVNLEPALERRMYVKRFAKAFMCFNFNCSCQLQIGF